MAALSGEPGYGELALRLDDPSPAAAAATVEAVRPLPHLAAWASPASRDLPEVRAPGDWPGKADTEEFAQLLGVITVLALLSALVLISNTMTTLVAEQTREIGIMRALGARRRQVALVYADGAAARCARSARRDRAGIVLSNLLARYFGSAFWAIDVGFGVDARVLLASLARRPRWRRRSRRCRRSVAASARRSAEALEASGSALGGAGRRRPAPAARRLPATGDADRTPQCGGASAEASPRRSIVALAVANLLAVLGLAEARPRHTRTSWGDHLEDVQISTGGRALFDERAEQRDPLDARSRRGRSPFSKNTVELAGREAFVWGVDARAALPLPRWPTAAGSTPARSGREPASP